jgi:transcription-repair coupling factor (superfamily II helicase)
VKNKILELYADHPLREEFIRTLSKDGVKVWLRGMTGSVKALFPAATVSQIPNRQIFVLTEKEEAAYFYSDLISLLGNEKVLFFPSSYKRSVQTGQLENINIVLRTEVLNRISSEEKNLLVVTYTEALAEKVITKKKLKENTLFLRKGEKISLDFLHEVLREYGFEQVDFVYYPGQYSIRGSIADVYSFSNDEPYRVDFFGDEVDSIRKFEVESQLSTEKVDKVSIVPNTQEIITSGSRPILFSELETFVSFVPEKTIFWTENLAYTINYLNDLYENTEFLHTEEKLPKEQVITGGHAILQHLEEKSVIEFGQNNYFKASKVIEFNTVPQPSFNKNFGVLATNLEEHEKEGFRNIILSDNEKQIERLNAIFQEIHGRVHFEPVLFTLHSGFIDYNLKLCCYTDHQIFERYHRFKYRGNFGSRESITLKELQGLHPGDFVVHIDHGIGQFGGLERIIINGKTQEAVRLVYQDKDVLYVSIHSLHRISKFKGKDGIPPKVYKLGSAAWQKLKDKTKGRIKDIAKDLIALYAKRKNEKGFAFSPDSYLQNELEASFIYEDTPDQMKATQAVKMQMESSSPMDMLVCGDVGFGKTEVAIRAAFKAVTDGKQVGVLVPTTLLAMQHYKTFSERLKNFPCTVEYISRLRSPKIQKEVLSDLPEGKVDILIGTHKLLGKEVKFKDLGLLIVDEEQKFGVAAKEKLKQIKINVDTLTLTATPIPRTLQFSLMGARDLSIINTPPLNRHPIITELHSFNEDVIRDSILYEVQRGGQIFFIHNRIQNIKEIEAIINKICPGIKTVVAHGQMEGNKLENIMVDFVNGNYDVLVSTSIIESGLDIPNANTIIINNAQHFGLSDLHQLRGRVGRSNKKAFCYLLAPPQHTLTGEARRRLRAIEEFSELGSGFNIAMQDLDIRGAGNLLGSEQSGFIADIGFEAYNKILNEAIQELKENEFKDLFAPSSPAEIAKQKFVSDCHIDTDLELLFPDEYVPNATERIHLYRTLDGSENEDQLLRFEKSIIDRFGQIPESTKELINVVRLRWLAIDLGFEKVILKNGKMILHFISNQMSPYYQSETFTHLLSFVQREPRLFRMREEKSRLTMSVDKIASVSQAILLLNRIKI